MLYTSLTIKDKEYKLRLNAQNSIDLEKRLGKNPLNILTNISEDNLPSVGFVVLVLHAALQAFHHGMSLEDTYRLYDEIIDTGKSIVDIIPIIMEVFKVSGYISNGDEEEDESKN